MKGFIRKGAGRRVRSGPAGPDKQCSMAGDAYDNIVDPCYPWRYAAMSRHEVNEAMAPQMMNGHILEQTVFGESL